MKIKFLTILAVAAITITSCKKNEDPDISDLPDSSIGEVSTTENEFNDIDNMSNEAGSTGSLSRGNASLDGLLSVCATVTKDSVSTPKKLTIDFGAANCLCNDGKYRRGKIIITHQGQFGDSGTTHTTTFDNYFVNDNQVTGTRTMVNNGKNAAGNPNFTVTVDGSIIKANNAGTLTWKATKYREWTAGHSTPKVIGDDIYSVTGNGSGTRPDGSTFAMDIVQPLIRKMELGCRKHFVKGQIKITPSGKPERLVDYGDGTCDDQATVTIKGKIHNITLK